MDLSLGSIMSGLVLGMLGMVLITYGKREQSLWPAVAGIVISVAPLVIASLLVQWGIAGACMGGLWWSSKHGYA